MAFDVDLRDPGTGFDIAVAPTGTGALPESAGGHWSAEPRRYPRRGLGSDIDLDDEDDVAILTLLALT